MCLFSARRTLARIELDVPALTLLEALVVPYRAGNLALAERYEALLTRGRGIRLVDPNRDHMRLAAQLRAATRAAAPDALQLATSLATGCSSFLTNAFGCRRYAVSRQLDR
ncbi:MAG: PIN domain-containing protein [Enhydrobacter sp.]|nr:PIN domain-containing protein [Enhydrobacter sp.]